MRGQESGSEHERETDGSAAPATPPPSFGRPAVRTEQNVSPPYPGGSYHPSHGDALAEPPFADFSGQVADPGAAGARPPIPVYQGPPPDLPSPEPLPDFPPPHADPPSQGGGFPLSGDDATAEHARQGLPPNARPLPAFPGVPAESWSKSAQPWEHGTDDAPPYDWFADPEPDADPSWPDPQQPGSQQPVSQQPASQQPASQQPTSPPASPQPAQQAPHQPNGQWGGPAEGPRDDSPWAPSPAAWQQGVEPVVPGAPPWQPPPGFTAAAAGMKVWPSPSDDVPAIPPWPAATGEPIGDANGDDEPLDPSMTVPFAHSAEPGDVPVWPPLPAGEEADDRIPDLPFDSSTWRRPKDGETPADVLDDVPAPPVTGEEDAFPSDAKDPDQRPEAEGPARFHGAIPLPAADAAPAPPDGAFAPPGAPAPGAPPPAPTSPGQEPPAQVSPAQGGPTGPPSGPQQGPPTGLLPTGPPMGGGPSGSAGSPGTPVAELPTPPHGAPMAPFDPFSPMPPGGLLPQPEPPAKTGNGKKALIATLGVLVVAGVATGGFFAYRSMSADRPADASVGPTAQPSVSAGPGDAAGSSSLLDSEGSDPEKMSINEAFPDKKIEVGGRVYTRVKVDMADDCKAAATGPFATALQDKKCSRVLRATYVDSKKRYAITTGIAVLPTKEAAAEADQAKDLGKNLWFRPLPASASSGADRVHIAGGYAAGLLWGRYIVFSYATYADGHTPTAKEKGLGTVSGAFRDHTSLVLERRITE
ncbi:hypothetical protein [Nonomuraea dietziae]|uniref:hypothetical protein n=1 Tax=Nonomuraea dietziae TaxID=65515 RepID=UPI0033F2F562